MNDQEIEDKIYKNANEWIIKTCLCDKIDTNKKRCFDMIKLMIPTQLKERKVGNKIEICRIDTTNRAEFERSLSSPTSQTCQNVSSLVARIKNG